MNTSAFYSLLLLALLTSFSAYSNTNNSISVEYRHSLYDSGEIIDGRANGAQFTYYYQLLDGASVYAGWSYDAIEHKSHLPLNGIDKTGYSLGLKIMRNYDFIQAGLYGGLTYKHYEFDIDDNDDPKDFGHEWGYELGGIVTRPLSENIHMISRLGYESSDDDVYIVGSRQEIYDNYLFSIGFLYNF
ncbi:MULTISPECIES: outer membrane beta-barrel protein [unclassified Salinivibrio]|uniref:outer membrane beta-barrel protein n=1 Tax=unclassified Salinivibrio TaxID=2636825 RepID=UPI00128B34F8|nr:MULTISPECIES: outer membrane beta-barrel protein [unclassified Salinivibrio]MPS33188.1 hypothetical protein [Salinivibrio sp. VYel7]MPX94573.1 hypothetical protein [Salinivibrio sp. VYel9]MPX97390.1 hypothetical protein [Salinivibrio sp. VYel6]MPY00860.1 hypothetical protein [Salinivibrio sp. VYel4]MPY03872.1 hypothetical protein [Salinivibrio sp. VYel5]